MAPSQDSSGKWRFISESPTKYMTILVVTVTVRGPFTRYIKTCIIWYHMQIFTAHMLKNNPPKSHDPLGHGSLANQVSIVGCSNRHSSWKTSSPKWVNSGSSPSCGRWNLQKNKLKTYTPPKTHRNITPKKWRFGSLLESCSNLFVVSGSSR